jgi:WD40 repeat protein
VGCDNGIAAVLELPGLGDLFRSEPLDPSPFDPVLEIAFSPDGSRIISSQSKLAIVRDVPTGEELARMPSDQTVRFVSFGSTGGWAFSGAGEDRAAAWFTRSGLEAARISGDVPAQLLALSGDGTLLAIGGLREILLWDVRAQAERARIRDGVWNLNSASIALDAAGELLISADEGTARVWDVRSQKELSSVTHHGDVSSVALSPVEPVAASSGWEGGLYIWNAQTGEVLSSPEELGWLSVFSVSFSPDGTLLGFIEEFGNPANGSGPGLYLYDWKSNREVLSVPEAGEFFLFSPDEGSVAFPNVDGVTLEVLDLETGKITRSFKHAEYIDLARFSHSGRWIVTTDENGTMRIWDVSTGEVAAQLAPDIKPRAILFSQDDELIGFADGDIVHFWRWQLEDLMARACERLPRNLTRDEWNRLIGERIPYHATCEGLPVPQE